MAAKTAICGKNFSSKVDVMVQTNPNIYIHTNIYESLLGANKNNQLESKTNRHHSRLVY